MLFGYVRVSTKTQNPSLQIDALLKEGVKEKNIFRDVSSGAKAERHDLDLMISRLREGDTVIVWKLDRIARSISHLLKLVDQFEKLGVKFKSINDPFIDTTSAHGKFIITLFGAVAQLERDIIIERTTAGLKSARRRGVQLGRKKGLGKEAKQKAMLAAAYYRENKLPIVDIMKLVGIKSKPTLYKYLAIQGRRNCKECGAVFWDETQEIDEAFCKKHYKK
ncbi:recombinase family protein [Maribacter polysiphoniae]|uniref:DNA invertase Pin-like site-specific DNA recombinase n=1 Tax=Maribacter polysiphoniae TaxID=429344 RepID=A0A316DWX8_9FLAO|nr:recombinase family protein [Maribacter polysiphoniae]MBD1261993.1 recombinase family protein [Maribacter polysiphoniae]PWK21679.1 DNA invertase Pin-like site-specific DNA recombinase [Maribacter polysiphoniae]